MGFISRIVITLALLISASHSQDSGGNCFSLNSSQTCPAFQQYYISTSLNSTYPFLSNITNVQSFDSAMLTYVDSSAFYLSKLGCTNKASISSIPYARYSLTFLCATLIQDSSYSLPCNYDNGLNPPPLCQSTCFEWTDSVNSITNNVDMCPNQDYQEMSMENLNSSCIYWSGLNGTYNCINGMANEPTNCGIVL